MHDKFDVSCDWQGCFRGALRRPERENCWPSLLEELRRAALLEAFEAEQRRAALLQLFAGRAADERCGGAKWS